MSTVLSPARALEAVAVEIESEYAACLAASQTAIEHGYRLGELLLEAKATVKHGEWLPWVRANCQFTPRNAQVYMRLAKHFANAKAASYFGTIDGALHEAAAVSEVREIVAAFAAGEPLADARMYLNILEADDAQRRAYMFTAELLAGIAEGCAVDDAAIAVERTPDEVEGLLGWRDAGYCGEYEGRTA